LGGEGIKKKRKKKGEKRRYWIWEMRDIDRALEFAHAGQTKRRRGRERERERAGERERERERERDYGGEWRGIRIRAIPEDLSFFFFFFSFCCVPDFIPATRRE
jgi:hypothetical protein